MKILITGATGFIGQHLIESLAGENVSVRIITRKSNAELREKKIQAEIVQGDLADSSVLEKAFRDVEIVINLAAELVDPLKFESTNVNSVKIMAALAKKNDVKKFIQLSSVGVVGMQYSPKHIVVDESTACFPKNGYEKSKLESERILLETFSNDKRKLVILRPTNVFGDEHPRNALFHFFQTIKNGKRMVCTEDAMVNYVYVNDLVSSIHHFIFKDAMENIYNVGNAMLFKDFFLASSKLIGKTAPLTILPRICFALPEAITYFGMKNVKAKLRSLSNGVIYSDERLQKEIPGIYRYGIEKGLQRTIEFYNSKGKL